MKTLYLDIFSGISGDMFIGALLDLGADFEALKRELTRLNLEGYHLHAARGEKSSISGMKFDVHLHDHHHSHEGHDEPGHAHPHEHEEEAHAHSHRDKHEHEHGHHDSHDHHEHEHSHSHSHPHEHGHTHHAPHSHSHDQHGRTFAEIRELILHSSLSDWVKQKSVAVFQRLANAEGKIHGVPAEQVHFHEVGAVDSIVDIVGGCVALEMLGRPRILAAAVTEGSGFIDCAHGRFPIPAPATLEVFAARGIPLTQCDEPNELVTPTGAAILAEFCESFGPIRDLTIEKVGFGLGTRDNKTRPNVLRAILGRSLHEQTNAPKWERDTIAVLETNLDDINPEILANFAENAMAAGALDVFHTPVQMKKNRPGLILTVLCAEPEADQFTESMLRQTSAFGVRRSIVERRKLAREFTRVSTPFGEVTVKVGRLDGAIVQRAPEFESCKKLAVKAGVPLKHVYEAANCAIQKT
jgi:uncharacterized protein (TIGR00299 family) protein